MEGVKRMNGAKRWLWLAAALASAACAGEREIRYAAGCDERLARPEKRQECRVCIDRPAPHRFLPDNPVGMRCERL